ncbi:DUF6468 domain-containing protein [Varunaivibrio sulfuroxidans]|nr:DUF6468 domain-containing protein [Varunaivibrio sulfuroxidans]WES31904.1 DUF6468 domain-containing protein [Varunaivibrio sulfuroxidans]
MPFSLILDVTVAVLLVVTIGYAIVLNGKLSRLRNDRVELESLGETFSASVLRTEQGLRRLKQTAEDLQDNITKAESLREDLAYLIDRGGVAADLLVEQVRQSRGAPGGEKVEGAEKTAKRASSGGGFAVREDGGDAAWRKRDRDRDKASDKTDDTAREASSDAERELLKALRSVR